MMLIPLFPLEIVVFPYESLNLHIFEPRYRELIQDCEKENIHFGIPYHRDKHPLKYGSIVRLESISNVYADGKMDIKTRGIRPFEVKRYIKTYPQKSYPGAYVEELYWEDEADSELRISIRAQLEELYQYMKIPKRPEGLHEDFITFQIAHKVGFNKDQEYAFLQMTTEKERQIYMLNHLKRMIPMIKEAEEMRQKIQLNGHYKYLTPPEL